MIIVNWKQRPDVWVNRATCDEVRQLDFQPSTFSSNDPLCVTIHKDTLYTVHTVCNANTSKVLVSFLASCPWVPAIQSPDKMLNNKKVFKEDNYCQGPCLSQYQRSYLDLQNDSNLFPRPSSLRLFSPYILIISQQDERSRNHEIQGRQKLQNTL